MNYRLAILTILLLLTLIQYTQADVASDMNNFFTDMGYAGNVTPPGVYEGIPMIIVIANPLIGPASN